MEFGLFTEFQAPAGRTDSAAFDESMTQMRLAEDLGYDAVWPPRRAPWMSPGGHIPNERVTRSMKLFAERVIPRLN